MAFPEPQLIQVMERLQSAIFGCDRHGRLIFVNAYGEALVGQLASSVQGVYLWDILPTSLGLTAAKVLICLENQTDYHWDCYDPLEEKWWQGFLYPDQVGLTLMMTDISQRQQSQILQQAQVIELEKWYHRFQTMGHLSRQIFWEWHQDTNWALWSGDTMTVLGHPLESMPRSIEDWMGWIHPEDQAWFQDCFWQACETKTCFAQDYRLRDGDGAYYWVSDRREFAQSTEGQTHGWGIIVDIHDRKIMELALAESEYRWRTIFEAAALGIVIVEPGNNYKLVSCNPSFSEFVGYSIPELLDLHPADLTFPEDWQREQALIHQCCEQSKKFYQFKKRYRHKNGQVLWANLTLSYVQDDQHNLQFIVALIENISDRQTLEDSLETERFRYQQLVENSPNLILSLDALKHLKTINWAALDVLDSLDTDEGQSYQKLLHPQESIERVEYLLDRVLQGESISDIELIFNSPDGQPHYMLTHLYPLVSHHQQQDSTGCVLISTDITAQKKALQDLNEREAQYRSVFESVTDGLHVFDMDTGKLVEANPAACAMHGYTYAEFMDLDPRQFVHPNCHAMFSNFMETVRAGKRFESEAQNICKDGSIIDIHVYGLQFTYRGRPHVLSVVRDITELKQIEAKRQQVENQLRESENLFRSLIHDLNVGVIVYGQTGDVQIVNHKACELLGLTEAEFLGKTCFDLDCQLLNEEGSPIPMEQHPVAQAIAQRQCIPNRVVGVHNHQTHDLHWLQATADPQTTPQGTVGRVIVTFSDISDRKRTEDQLRHQAEREQALNHVIQSIRDSIDIETIFTTTVQQIGSLLKLDRALITEYMPEQKGWVAIHEHRPDPSTPTTLGVIIPEEDNPVSDQVKQGKMVRLDRIADTDLANDHNNPCAFIEQSGGWLIFPLVINHQTWGTLTLQRYDEHPNWQDHEIALAQSVVNQLAVAIRQAQLYRDLQHANAELSRLATIDGLTQIANRRHFDLHLSQEWQRCLREQACLSLVLCDVDYFKPYNDHYGHQAGDDCLIQIAQTLAQAARRSTDLIARYGGEEFALVLPNTDLDGTLRVIHKIQEALHRLNIPHLASSIGDRITISFGVVTLTPHSSRSLDEFLNAADQSLYHAKQSGRNTYCIHYLSYSNPASPETTSPDLRIT
ncbi:PAS domain S-box protein [Candidatus Synechococcus calcipolaris G9]|uniref:PAS domain S-box protein n=1 Tax=Candidatus Synechococcus calcipolaris G9 TaxID=1497997 RepID=A0ABT6EZ33_9SYNE|nr:PAS domain S-box protein [Candidatus Synechococcus calcipolaris]MDG2990708.1 PAS domain S-box protein [Candidatus Synechococcus calcipolaris G9]